MFEVKTQHLLLSLHVLRLKSHFPVIVTIFFTFFEQKTTFSKCNYHYNNLTCIMFSLFLINLLGSYILEVLFSVLIDSFFFNDYCRFDSIIND
jgi:hypothetical protein